MTTNPRRTEAASRALQLLLNERAGQELYGLQIGELLAIPTGTIYPVLIKLAVRGWLLDRREDIDEPWDGGHAATTASPPTALKRSASGWPATGGSQPGAAAERPRDSRATRRRSPLTISRHDC